MATVSVAPMPMSGHRICCRSAASANDQADHKPTTAPTGYTMITQMLSAMPPSRRKADVPTRSQSGAVAATSVSANCARARPTSTAMAAVRTGAAITRVRMDGPAHRQARTARAAAIERPAASVASRTTRVVGGWPLTTAPGRPATATGTQSACSR